MTPRRSAERRSERGERRDGSRGRAVAAHAAAAAASRVAKPAANNRVLSSAANRSQGNARKPKKAPKAPAEGCGDRLVMLFTLDAAKALLLLPCPGPGPCRPAGRQARRTGVCGGRPTFQAPRAHPVAASSVHRRMHFGMRARLGAFLPAPCRRGTRHLGHSFGALKALWGTRLGRWRHYGALVGGAGALVGGAGALWGTRHWGCLTSQAAHRLTPADPVIPAASSARRHTNRVVQLLQQPEATERAAPRGASRSRLFGLLHLLNLSIGFSEAVASGRGFCRPAQVGSPAEWLPFGWPRLDSLRPFLLGEL